MDLREENCEDGSGWNWLRIVSSNSGIGDDGTGSGSCPVTLVLAVLLPESVN
jgi:hypothetical protein